MFKGSVRPVSDAGLGAPGSGAFEAFFGPRRRPEALCSGVGPRPYPSRSGGASSGGAGSAFGGEGLKVGYLDFRETVYHDIYGNILNLFSALDTSQSLFELVPCDENTGLGSATQNLDISTVERELVCRVVFFHRNPPLPKRAFTPEGGSRNSNRNSFRLPRLSSALLGTTE